MNVLPSNEQQRLVSATETAIKHTRNGMTPNEAIEKVAVDEGYSPEFISRMVQGFNKAKAVHRMKEASAGNRHESFDLADTSKIVTNIYAPAEKEASVDFSLPSNLALADSKPVMEKTASLLNKVAHIKNPELTSASYSRALRHQADFFGKLEKIAHTEVTCHKERFLRSIENICDYCRPMTNKELQKTARMAVNGYPGIGDKMMKIVAHKIRRDIPEGSLQKTASGIIFPAKEPFISMHNAYTSAQSMAEAEVWHGHVEKEAAAGTQMLSRFLSQAAADRFGDMHGTLPGASGVEGTAGDPNKADELLGSDYFNKMKALEAKRSLYDMMLTDDKFKGYKHNEMVGAWNSLAKSHPKLLTQNPAAASTLMLQQLETGGRRDLHEIEQAQKVEKNIEEA
jgi:hypothetical protein